MNIAWPLQKEIRLWIISNMKLMDNKKVIVISTSTIIKALALTILAMILLRVIGTIGHQLRLIGISLFLAMALNPAVSWITSRLKSKSRLRATGFAYIIVVTLLIGFFSLVIPPIVRQTTGFVRELPNTINNIKYQDSALSRTIVRYNLQDRVDQIRDDYAGRIKNLDLPIYDTAGRIGGTVVSIITVLVLTFMMLVEAPMWSKRILALESDEKKRKHLSDVSRRMYRVVTGFVNGQVLIAGIAASVAAVVMFVLNSLFNASINPMALAGIVFIFGLIPLIGNIIAAALVVLVIMLSSVPMAIAMGLFFLVYQQIENATLQPYIQSRNNQLTPLSVFIVALLGAGLGGLLGALAAIPIAGCAKIFFDEYVNLRLPNFESFNKNNKRQ